MYVIDLLGDSEDNLKVTEVKSKEEEKRKEPPPRRRLSIININGEIVDCED